MHPTAISQFVIRPCAATRWLHVDSTDGITSGFTNTAAQTSVISDYTLGIIIIK